jgi:beta-phosphoglucomutase-like phosphatase (HAD superfamily)
MDGTLIDSTAGVVGAWEEFAKMYPYVKDNMRDILSSCVAQFCLDFLPLIHTQAHTGFG